MGGAMVKGWCRAGMAESITITAHTQQTLDRYQALYPQLTGMLSNAEAVRGADVVVLAVKPWLVAEVMDEIQPVLDAQRSMLVSVAAGVRHPRIDLYAMPNIAVEYGEGMTFVEKPATEENLLANWEALFAPLGSHKVVSEAQMMAGMQLSGCGIAYVMRYVRAMMEGGVALGLRPSDALDTVLQTMKGAATLLQESGLHPEQAIDQVTTPGGFTIKGLNAMEQSGFTKAVLAGLMK